MAKKNVYAVKKGKKTGLYYSWEECKAMVIGFSGAEYKGFLTEEEARIYLESDLGNAAEADMEADPSDCLIAYVDGSFDKKIGKYAFGCVLITPEGNIVEKSGNGEQPDSLAIRNIAGEVLGAMYAVQWGIHHEYEKLNLYYDYEGIEKWATGVWRTNNALTQKYADFMSEKRKKIQISFRKVKAHSGNQYNEQADLLAKKALKEG